MVIRDVELQIIDRICDLRIVNRKFLAKSFSLSEDISIAMIDDINDKIICLADDICALYPNLSCCIEELEYYTLLWSNINMYDDKCSVFEELLSILSKIELMIYNFNRKKIHHSKVLLVNIDCSVAEVNQFTKEQDYENICVIDLFNAKKIIRYSQCRYLDTMYVSFCESGYIHYCGKIKFMLDELEKQDKCNVLMSPPEYFLPNGTLIHGETSQFDSICCNSVVEGRQIIQYSIITNASVYGSLSNIFCKGFVFSDAINRFYSKDGEIESSRIKILFNILMYNDVYYTDKLLVHRLIKDHHSIYRNNKNKKKFFSVINHFINKGELQSLYYDQYLKIPLKKEIKKEVTVFYTDSAEYFCIEPIAKYAIKRGYTVKYSKNILEEAEIGIYAYHAVYPVNSKLSIIMLHDMAQRHDIWPNIWYSENWSKFDIGILPGKQWADRWSLCASAGYVRPRIGAFMLGYPKADAVKLPEIKKKATAIRSKLKYDFTVLYAPSWENDGKEDDFVQALVDLPVNLLIKQVPVSENPIFKFVADNQKVMRELHENKYDNLTYLNRDDNIILALEICDMVVSDESSVMTEATFFNKPSLAVIDWLIPDRVPSRLAVVPAEYIVKTKKESLRENVLRFLNDPRYYKEICALGRDFFANKGDSCKDILDLIDACVENKKIPKHIEEKRINSKYEEINLWS